MENHDLENQINNYINGQYKNGNAENISVYFTNLLNGQWSSVNENTEYHPGSMMKVLIMMAYYRELRTNKSLLSQNYVYSEDVNQIIKAVPYSTPTDLRLNQNYTVQYLINDMIENSDDGAETLLLKNANQTILNEAYEDFNISAPNDNTPDYTISVKDYATFLRVLYNSTYLSENSSEAALKIMSESTFKDGLVAGLPSDITVAHKYGSTIDTDSKTQQITGTELHDCGIIYANKYTYELCVMTKAKGNIDIKQLSSVLKGVSSIVYNYVSTGSGK